MIYRFLTVCLSAMMFSGCDNINSNDLKADNNGSAEFIKKVKKQFVHVEGGKFEMGDFGVEHYEEHLPLDPKQDSKPLHEVELSSFSISKFKTTNEEFQYYQKYEGIPIRKGTGPMVQKAWDTLNRLKNTPAHADWYEADKYCTWLGKVTNLPISLATEAQWEYAARSGGKYFVTPTDDGTWKVDPEGNGINIATDRDRMQWRQQNGIPDSVASALFTALPGDKYPANPLGIYDMSGNGLEWVKDWYDPNYYQHSPVKDPQGPKEPSYINPYGKHSKVLRADEFSAPGKGITVVRNNQSPDNNGRMPFGTTFRCVVNSASPVQ